MIRNGIYSLIALAIDGVDVEVGGVLILLDGNISERIFPNQKQCRVGVSRKYHQRPVAKFTLFGTP